MIESNTLATTLSKTIVNWEIIAYSVKVSNYMLQDYSGWECTCQHNILIICSNLKYETIQQRVHCNQIR